MASVLRRTIDGVEYEGTRLTQTLAGKPELTNTVERWYSGTLKLTALAVASGPYGTHTARIENLRSVEPDSDLFTIPSDYRVVDIGSKQ